MEIRFGNEIYNLKLAGHRKLLHQDVENYVNGLEWSDELQNEIDLIHELISNQKIEELTNEYFEYSNIDFYEVEENELLENALASAGYSYQKSNVSRSIYAINDNNEEVRISDHKRPAIVENGFYVGDHEYENEIIVFDNIVYLKQLHANGFSKLNKNEYLLG